MSENDFSAAMARLRARIDAAKATSSPSTEVAASNAPNDTSVSSGAERLLAGLNPAQKTAVTSQAPYMLVVAGAGSGKTKVLTTRIAYLIATGRVAPGEILAITFTNKAAKEMRERLEGLLGPQARYMWISTFHSACVRILRAEHEAIGMRSTFTIYDSADSLRLMTIVAREEGIESKAHPPKKLIRAVSDLKNELVSAAEFDRAASGKDEQILARAYLGYQKRLARANALDFDDLIMKTVEVLRSHPMIAQHYRRRFRHILVDEYQDTNVAQYELIRTLVGDTAEAVHGELTVVGDADQSIYAFRGATIRNIQDFEKDFPDSQTVLLEQNYRSTQNILSAANAVISNNDGRRAKNLWTDSGSGEPLVGYVADAESDESAFVVEEIDKLRTNGYKYGDFAVFYRANAQSRALEEMFVRSGIPYKVVGGTKFYDRKEIKDAIAYLHAVVNPDDTVSIRRILNEPKRGLGAKAEEAVAFHAARHGISFGAALSAVAHPELGQVEGLTPRARASMTEFVLMLEDMRKQSEEGQSPADILDNLMDASGYLDVLQKSNDPQDEVRVENLAELHSVASDFRVLNPQGTLGEFLDQIALVSDTDQIPDGEGEGQVVLMTIHTAKGLEFPVVFVTGLEDGTFPHIRSLGSGRELAEERRLAYVALTRARERLYVTRAATRSQYGAPQSLPPSRFLEEIPQEIITWRRSEASVESLRGGWGGVRWSSRSRDLWNDDDFAPAFGGKTSFTPGKLDEAQSVSTPVTGEQKTGGLSVGDRVRHKSFGTGTVVSFEGAGKSTVAKVKFTNGATKRLMLRFAPLEKIS
ncbi:DNA helicase PcrA [Arcanobacterium canis]|uniref:ATP-dependent DNA helicase n=1 Tax=Arcanobacterium canis TaxID=999183 RepID=A0ABY8FZ94_9ACTO|nr:DNA helicase PcrA [Arcanobacterium canis]WFM83842.1 DNA helicase PcrA [Arcanobacterium canis]